MTSFAHTIQIRSMPVFPPIIQKKPIRDFEKSKLHMIFFKDARYPQIPTLPYLHLRRISIPTCMKWLGEGEHIMPIEMVSAKQSGQKALVRQSGRKRSGTKM